MKRREYYEEQKIKRIIYIFGIALVLSIVLFLTIFVLYNQKLRKKSNESLANLRQMNDIVPNTNDDIAQTSFSSDVSVEDVNKNINTTKKVKNTVNTTPIPAVVDNTIENKISEEKKVEKKEYAFIAPVAGEIIKDYAADTLVYSNTLEEWTTHMGIDIKSPKTTIVVASEEGQVESIKNDPRYGLTITIKHGEEYKTVYSNLLTSEFVKQGEDVEKGQTIGTIGDSSSFEIADDAHLHFEMYKNGESVNPTLYLKDI